MASMTPDTGPTTVQRPPMPTATAIPSWSGPAPGRVTARTGHLPGDGRFWCWLREWFQKDRTSLVNV